MSPLSAALGEDDRPATWPQGRSVLDLLGARGSSPGGTRIPGPRRRAHRPLLHAQGAALRRRRRRRLPQRGGDDGYNSGGGYTIHQLQLKVVAAEELNALLWP